MHYVISQRYSYYFDITDNLLFALWYENISYFHVFSKTTFLIKRLRKMWKLTIFVIYFTRYYNFFIKSLIFDIISTIITILCSSLVKTIHIRFIFDLWDDRRGIFVRSPNQPSVIKFDHLQTRFLVTRSLHRRLVARGEFRSVLEFARKLHFGRRWESRQMIFDLGRHRLGVRTLQRTECTLRFAHEIWCDLANGFTWEMHSSL